MSGWKDCQLGDVIELKRGYDLPQRERIAGPFPIISSSGFSDTHRDPKVKGPGVVTGRYGTIGTVYYVEGDFWPLNTTLYVRDFKGNDPRFVSYFLRGIDFLAYSDKAAVPGVNRNHLHQAQISFPPVAEQRSIAAVLGALDDKIELNRRMNETLEAIARAIFKDWFVDFGPTRAKMEGRASYLAPDIWSLFPNRLDDEGKPKGWKNCAISELCKRVENGGTPARGEPQYWSPPSVPWLTSGEVRTPIIAETAQYISELGLQNSSAKTWPIGTTVVAMYGATAGQICLLGTSVSANQACCGLIPKAHMREYVFIALREDRSGLASKATGSAQQNLSQRLIADHAVIAPSLECVQAFSEATESLFARWISNEFENNSLREVRDLLLPKLMSGEIRVKDAEKPVSEVV